MLIPFGRIDAESLVYPRLGTENEFICHHPDLPAWLERLGACFDLAWATAWEHDANEVLSPVLGMPPLPVITFRDGINPGENYKLPAIKRYVGDRPCAWVDDVIGTDAELWALTRATPTLFHETRADRGLQEEDVELLEGFAAEAMGR